MSTPTTTTRPPVTRAAELREGDVAEHAKGFWPRPMVVLDARTVSWPWNDCPHVVVMWSSGETMPLTPDAPFTRHATAAEVDDWRGDLCLALREQGSDLLADELAGPADNVTTWGWMREHDRDADAAAAALIEAEWVANR